MSASLLVYEEVPEKTTFYVFNEPTAQQTFLLEAAQGTFINSVQTEAADKAAEELSLMLADKPANMTQFEPAFEPLRNAGITSVYFAGFLL